MDPICVVITTYKRKELLLRCLHSLKVQSLPVDLVIIMDNSCNSESKQYILSHKTDLGLNIQYNLLSKNHGGAGGFSLGLKVGLTKFPQGCLFWLMDDDGYPSTNCLEILVKHVTASNFVGPLVLDDKNKNELSFPIRLNHSSQTISSIYQIQAKILPDVIIPFNGVLISSKLIHLLGTPKAEFFIWGDDFEFVYRLRSKGFQIFTITEAEFYHPKNKGIGSPMFFKLFHFNDSNSFLKLYCYSRNNTWNILKYKNKTLTLLFLFKIIWFYLFTSRNIKKLKVCLSGFLDGLVGDFSKHSKYLEDL